ncbi:MAG: very short patch repair endonuclease [Alphaproteobacteria bacterium]|nr:very short patch repair endonuclease [Alphaproteobacteria bacterium]
MVSRKAATPASSTDVFTPEQRSRVMGRVKGKNTEPEMTVRRLTHALGYRFRLHRTELPGSPDLVFPGRRKVIFVHGCFWHGHDCPRGSRQPKQNADYWRAKFARNVERDRQAVAKLGDQGWEALTLWECELKDVEALKERLEGFLS